MKIKYEIEFSEKELATLRKRRDQAPKYFDETVDEMLENKNHFKTFLDLVVQKLNDRFADDDKVKNPDLEHIKQEILFTLHIYGYNDKHNRFCLWEILETIDPHLARRAREEGASVVFDELYGEDEE